MNKLTITTLTAAGLLIAGIGTATALPGDFHSASTPGQTPTVFTPSIATPHVSTGPITTPEQSVRVGVAPIQLPASVSAGLGGLVSKEIETPAATPALEAAPTVPSLTVADVDVASVGVDEIPVAVDLPAAATVSEQGAHAWSSGLPTQLDAAQGNDGAAVHAAGATVTIGLDD